MSKRHKNFNRKKVSRKNSQTESLFFPWYRRLPGYIRPPLKILFIISVPILALAGLPLLVLLVLLPGKEEWETLDSKLLVMGLLLFGLMMISSGSSLIEFILTGELCWGPSVYAGVSCHSPDKSLFSFTISLLFLWPVFWITAAAVIVFFRSPMP